ncbi:phosphoribosylanthranilate isomerase [Pseudohalocynthiibacter aestuariivivens]|jgi:phosphoribosylanthranilate isomerase|uniref:N-(5'-phosphoribosyl)anthranilate isomerase n=1 Tax=Pseudohalocynthiibacter aestuariivivens TaxID=1591409 RepID=A0ABV5JKM8_9RHOB|nr:MULTISPECIES: phosphoribosylanthranilate isomerase [Pseudohalocynthiibacter]MBS9717336.1 phosphoribosylanthranilate isomerase [Pseudohalocynthiibacter aestuariivivens]MCK0102330.1 phosphoribosylanthranilate isomerase [Pseudohalocynthiibacter sp. F2068]
MVSEIKVKICGLRDAAHVAAAAKAGAAYVGFNFFSKSPRYISVDDARSLAVDVPLGIAKVALTVNADNAFLDDIVGRVPLDMLQLHGSESVERVAEIRARYGLPVMKVIGVADEGDLAAISEFSKIADQLLIDAKPPKEAELPGGNGLSFDWRLIAGQRWSVPWMLAGGLTPLNVAEAISMTGAKQVDVASGVETAPGVKDERLIADFIKAARGEKT